MGWPNDKSNVKDEAKFYFKMRDDILVEMTNDRILIPTSLRKEMLKLLHDYESHQGITKIKTWAREIFY